LSTFKWTSAVLVFMDYGRNFSGMKKAGKNLKGEMLVSVRKSLCCPIVFL